MDEESQEGCRGARINEMVKVEMEKSVSKEVGARRKDEGKEGCKEGSGGAACISASALSTDVHPCTSA